MDLNTADGSNRLQISQSRILLEISSVIYTGITNIEAFTTELSAIDRNNPISTRGVAQQLASNNFPTNCPKTLTFVPFSAMI